MKAKLVVRGKEFDVDIIDPKLQELINLADRVNSGKKRCKDCDYAVKGFFGYTPDKYVCIGVKEPFVIGDINKECTEY